MNRPLRRGLADGRYILLGDRGPATTHGGVYGSPARILSSAGGPPAPSSERRYGGVAGRRLLERLEDGREGAEVAERGQHHEGNRRRAQQPILLGQQRHEYHRADEEQRRREDGLPRQRPDAVVEREE